MSETVGRGQYKMTLIPLSRTLIKFNQSIRSLSSTLCSSQFGPFFYLMNGTRQVVNWTDVMRLLGTLTIRLALIVKLATLILVHCKITQFSCISCTLWNEINGYLIRVVFGIIDTTTPRTTSYSKCALSNMLIVIVFYHRIRLVGLFSLYFM